MSYYENCRSDVLAVLPEHVGRVLDVGCGAGATGRALLDAGRATEVDGIELMPDAAARARGAYGQVLVGDLESIDFDRLGRAYDTVMCNDVLEHVGDPWTVLSDLLGAVTRPGSTVVVSLPNVQCVEVVAPLLRGRFEYVDDGILDRTHLRFFTRRSARTLVEGAGLRVTEEADARVGASRGLVHRAAGRLLGPFGVRQLLTVAAVPEAGRVAAHPSPTRPM